MSQKKRPFVSTIDDLSRTEPNKKTLIDPSPNGVAGSPLRPRKRPVFASYKKVPNLSPKIKLLCEILANTPSSSVESSLEDTGIRIGSEDVEEVLKLSYSFPAPAVKFFRWAGNKHSPYAWNLMVDLLGKNGLFEAMWDVVKSMRKEGLLSLATFASIFGSYVSADRVGEAIETFEVLSQYGIPNDVVALNSLLSAICRDGLTSKAQEFFDRVKGRIRPDFDTFAILLEGWEMDADVANARKTFGDMVLRFGWDPANVPAYDSFLNNLIKGVGMDEAMKLMKIMKDNRCLPGMKFFRNALEMSFKEKNARDAMTLWDVLIECGFTPDTAMYNSMIGLFCHINQLESAYRFFDEMVYNGAFPDSQTYNTMLQFLLKNKILRNVSVVFNEMVKNECIGNHSTCATAIHAYLDAKDLEMALNVWKHMVENNITPNEEIANSLLVAHRDLDRLPEALTCAQDMIDRGIKISSSTMSKLKHALNSARKGNLFEDLQMKWKAH